MSTTATAEKPYSICSEPRTNYLYVHVSGETDSLEISLQFWKEIRERIIQRQAVVIDQFGDSNRII